MALQKHKKMFEVKAKANMSEGGKGSTTLPKVDTRKEISSGGSRNKRVDE